MQYTVRPGDTLWAIAARELGDSGRWREIAELNRLNSPYLLFVGETLRLPPRGSVRAPAESLSTFAIGSVPSGVDNPGPALAAVQELFRSVDSIEELRGASLLLEFPDNRLVQLRQSNHPSGLQTAIVARVEMPRPADHRSFWDRWGSVTLNCGGMVLSAVSVAASGTVTVASLGGGTPLLVLSYVGLAGATAQCGLAVAKETSPQFQEFVEGDNGVLVDVADIALDVISLAGSAAAATTLVRQGGNLLQNVGNVSKLNSVSKGKLLKVLQRLEKQEGDVEYIRKGVAELRSRGKLPTASGGRLTNNHLKKALPYLTSSLRAEQISMLADSMAIPITVLSSMDGGVGSQRFGTVRVSIRILQQRFDGE